MRSLFPFLTMFVSGELHERVARLKHQSIFLAAIGFFALIAVIFGLVAGQSALASVYGPVYAGLMMAGGALVVCVVLFIAMKIVAVFDRRRALRRRKANKSFYTASALSLAPALLRSKKTAAVGLPLAVIAGAAYFFLRRGNSEDED